MSLAVYDAVRAAGHDRKGHAQTAARDAVAQSAAAAQAAHDTLAATFPSYTATLDQQVSADLGALTPNHARAVGVQAGAQAAVDVLSERAPDGAAAPPPPYQSTLAPGDYRPTPPAFTSPVFTHWGAVTPFVLRSADQFRPPALPPLTSPAYAAAINEVKILGQDTSTTRTAEQTTIGKFWSARSRTTGTPSPTRSSSLTTPTS
jgi:hypothetical protein